MSSSLSAIQHPGELNELNPRLELRNNKSTPSGKWFGSVRRDKRHTMAQRSSEKSFSFIPWTLIPPWHATDSLFNVYSVVCPADRYLVNQRVSCPCSNSCRHPLPVAALFALLPSSSPSPPPLFSAHLFFHSRTRSLALCRTTNAIYRPEFVERVRAFTHANAFLPF